MAKFLLQTPWETEPDSNSTYEIYNADDNWIEGNAEDDTNKYDGDTFTALEGGAPKGNLFIVYKQRLMISGDPDFPNRIWYSHVGNAEGWSTKTDWIDIYPEDGGSINDLHIRNDELIISKDVGRKYGWRIYEDGNPTNSRLRIIEDDKGNVSPDSGLVLEDIHYYLDRNGVFTLPRTQRGGITEVVKEVIDGIKPSNFKDIAMGGNDGKVYISLFDIDIDLGDTVSLTDAVLVFDTINQTFYLRDSMDARVYTRFIDSSGSEDLYFGDTEGRVFKVDDGNLANQSAVHMRIRTKPYFREMGRQVTVNKVGIYMDNPDNTSVFYRTNLQEGFKKKLGVVNKEPVHWFDVNATGGLFQMELYHGNTNERPTVWGFDIDYDVKGKKND